MAILSAVQFQPKLARSMAEVGNNYRQCEELIHQAGRLGSQFIVFPELCFTGYSFQSKDEAALVCEKPDGPTFRFMRGVALELKAYVSWGYVETDGTNLYNSATLVSPDGKVLTSYRKVNLFSSDFLWATSGLESAPVVQTEFGATSIVVCRDLRNKIPLNIPRTASKSVPLFGTQKLDLVAACVNWGKSGYPANSWMDFVAEHRCTLIISNRWGKEEGSFDYKQDFGQGGSIVIEPDWKCHTGGIWFNRNCVVTANTET
jgi:predicted amidohydrolase